MGKDWETLDTEKLIRQREQQNEQTTSAGVGGYEKPLGTPLRPVRPYKIVKKSKKKAPKE